MNHTKGPWFVKLSASITTGEYRRTKYLTIDEDSGPVHIVDEDGKAVASIAHRANAAGASGFSETACNARLIEHSPELLVKAQGLLESLSSSDRIQGAVKELKQVVEAIVGKDRVRI